MLPPIDKKSALCILDMENPAILAGRTSKGGEKMGSL